MSFIAESINEAKNIITERRMRAESEAHARLLKAYSLCPELKEIDSHFPKIGQAILEAFSSDPSKAEEKIALLRKDSEELNAAREECLKSAGLDKDYTSPKYSCEKCKDTGYLEFKMCDCMKRELVLLGYKNSGLGALLEKQSFDNFSLDYYEPSDRELMEANLVACKSYAENFDTDSASLLLMGSTGLGKTHLSTSIARAVIDKGYDVLYETSENLISAFSYERFNRGYGDNSESRTDRYYECDLLIIDDFGTEVANQFSVSCFYNLINTRTSKALPTIINTNLSAKTMLERYTDRVYSRLMGEFAVLQFGDGEDIRMKKLF